MLMRWCCRRVVSCVGALSQFVGVPGECLARVPWSRRCGCLSVLYRRLGWLEGVCRCCGVLLLARL